MAAQLISTSLQRLCRDAPLTERDACSVQARELPPNHQLRSCTLQASVFVAVYGTWLRSRRQPKKTVRNAAAALKRIVKEDTKTRTASTRDLWGVIIRAPIQQFRWKFWKPVEIRLGLRTLAVDDFATLLQDALPELMTLHKAKQAASELVENAMVNERNGEALLLGDAREKAERCRRQLISRVPDLEVTVQPMA